MLEETPILDTYETRTRIRIAVGVAGVLGMLALGMLIYRSVVGTGPDLDDLVDEGQVVANAAQAAPAQRERAEVEARVVFDQARQVGRNGQTEQAVSLLRTVTKTYPGTAAARDAEEALRRPAQNLPLFLDGPAVTATPAEPTPEPPAEQPELIAVTPAAAPTTPGAVAVAVAPPGSPDPASPATAPEVAVRPLPVGFRPSPGTGIHPSGWPLEVVGDRDGSTLVLVPGGSIALGRNDGPSNEGPAQTVAIATFYIDRHEVTVGQYARFLAETGDRPGSGKNPPEALGESFPVVNVSARDARAYADWAGKRLPSEPEWELAGRTPDGRLYPAVPRIPNGEGQRKPRQLDPVMSFVDDQSPFGVFDLAGNALEWTSDWYEPRHNPAGPSAPAANLRSRDHQLVVKGGSRTWTLTGREPMKIDTRLPFLGFRCVLEVEPPIPRSSAPAPGAAPGAGGSLPVIPF